MKKILFVATALFCASSLHAATLQWDKAEHAATYKVFVKEKNAKDWTLLQDGVTGTSFKVPSLEKADQDYELTVQALNRFGNSSDLAIPVQFNPLQETAIEAPKNLRITIDVNLNVNINSPGK